MRTSFSLLVIVFSVLALGMGYLGGRSSASPAVDFTRRVQPADFRMPAPVAFARSLHGAHSLDRSGDQVPAAAEDAVVSNALGPGRPGGDATVALVIEDAGASLKLALGFLDFPVPVTLAIDPAGDEAAAVAAAANERGKSVYAEFSLGDDADAKMLKVRIEKLRTLMPSVSGLAVRFTGEREANDAAVLGPVLRDERLHFLDLSGIDARAGRKLAAASVVSRRRDVTIDNRDDPAYVQFMLAQAVEVARGRGTAVVVAHPYPGSLAVLRQLVAGSGRDGVHFAQL